MYFFRNVQLNIMKGHLQYTCICDSVANIQPTFSCQKGMSMPSHHHHWQGRLNLNNGDNGEAPREKALTKDHQCQPSRRIRTTSSALISQLFVFVFVYFYFLCSCISTICIYSPAHGHGDDDDDDDDGDDGDDDDGFCSK